MTDAAPLPSQPWRLPWWRWVPGQGNVFLYLITIHLLALVGLVLFPLPSLPVLLVALGLGTLGSLGTTVVYHRALAHRALDLHPAVEQALVFFAIFSTGSAPATWVANHRNHHANSDTPLDVSSPRHGGFLWAHLRWLYQMPDSSVERWCPDLRARRYALWERLQAPILVVSAFSGAFFGWEGLFWIGPIRLAYILHMQMVVNSVMHMGPEGEGGEDSSLNVWWLGPFQLGAWGENWHRNHHAEANAARFGRTWRQTDVGWYAILALEKLRLAKGVRRDRTGPARPVMARRRAA